MKTPVKKKSVAEKRKNFINWFEIPVSNIDRAVKFYNDIFEIDLDRTEMNGYAMAFFPVEEGVGGALICGEGSIPSEKGPLLYLNGGDDLSKVLKKVEKAGGKVILDKQMINESNGYFGLFIDSEGNKMALHSPH